MRELTPIQYQLLNILADGAHHPGPIIANTLGISRTAVWKNIETLQYLGLAFNRNPKKGYQLITPLIPLSKQLIENQLQHRLSQPFDLHLFASIDSTNAYLKSYVPNQGLTCCLAETQTAGRGRFQRYWHSPFGENIYCSVALQLESDLSRLSGLSLIVSLAIYEVLQSYTSESIFIKWPNDLLWNHKKLAGVLIEMTAEGHGYVDLIIGMGININSITTPQKKITKPWCSLRDMTQKSFDRNLIVVALIEVLDSYLQQFLAKGFVAFQDKWNALDYLHQKKLTVSRPNGVISGKGCGVNDLGLLMIEDSAGITHAISSGEATIAQTIDPN